MTAQKRLENLLIATAMLVGVRSASAAETLRLPQAVALAIDNTFLNWGRFMPTQSTSVGVSLT